MSERSQQAILWWSIAFAVIYGVCVRFLLDFLPPPHATLNAHQIAQFYAERHDQIRIGATITSWTSGFMVPLFAVFVVQMARVEVGRIWTVMCAMGGALMTIFLVLPPMFWGAAAYTQNRASDDATAIMHELGTLTFTSTNQYYMFAWVAIVVVCFLPQKAPYSPFTRKYGYFTAWVTLMFEPGPFVYLPRTGPFAWDGVVVFWIPLSIYGIWMSVTYYVLFRALRQQRAAADADAATLSVSPA